jgi:TonB-dependent receptor
MHTGDALPGANVFLVGTSLGASTDLNGRFLIPNIPPGGYTIRTTYVGYKANVIHVHLTAGSVVTRNFKLEAVGIRGKEVVITAQAAGQNAAINQQLSSNQIVNVVSAARIQELPDANAAESVGRLPGVSVLRSGGEAYAVVIRGLQPKYNQITIDGVQMGSSSSSTRFTDLSMISSNMLGGIEVYKTISPDMDADVIGGTVNFEMREAHVKQPGVPEFSLTGQGGYNALSDAYSRLNNYKYVGTAEDRFFGDRFGVFAQVDVERINLSSNELGASYNEYLNSLTQYVTTGLNLYDIPRDRRRYNGALVLDYKLPEGRVKLTNFLSTGTTNTKTYSELFDLNNNIRYYGIAGSNSTLSNIVDIFELNQQLPIFHVNLRLSHVYSETKSPNSWNVNFQQTQAGLNQFINKTNVNPEAIPAAANNDFSSASLNQFNVQNSFYRQRALTGSIDLSTNLNFSSDITAEIKFGGEYKHVIRSYTTDVLNGSLFVSGVSNIIFSYFSLPSDAASMKYWIDPNFKYGTFLNGDYTMVAPLNYGMFSRLLYLLNSNVENFAKQNEQSWYGVNTAASITNNYSGFENTSAFYLMSVIKFGQQVSLIPGVRYQNLETIYTAPRGFESALSYMTYNYYDTTVTMNHGYWLPDVSLNYKPVSWLNLRLAYSNTLAYPDFSSITPRIDVGLSSISWNNYSLTPGRSANYDFSLSVYNNAIGLFTVDPFLKQIRNLIYSWSYYVSGTQALQYIPASLSGTPPSPTETYQILTYVNNPYLINDYGLELDWETHFWYLPGPLSGLVFSANYTHIFSKAQYPYTLTRVTSRAIQYVDTSFTDRLIDQPDDIVNLTLGYDYQGFSVRVAFLYQSNVFAGANFWPQLRSYTPPYRRWDIAAKQDLPWSGLQLYLDLNNINGANDISIIRGGGVPISEQDYGMTADVGFRWRL